MHDEGDGYRAVSRRYRQRFGYRYTEHVFDKLQFIDLALAEFEQILVGGEVIAEAPLGLLLMKEIVLLIEWTRPLHVVVAVDEGRRRETLVTVYEPYPSEWTDDFRRRR